MHKGQKTFYKVGTRESFRESISQIRVYPLLFYKDLHVDQNQNEDSRVCSCPQSTYLRVTVNIMQHIETKAIENSTEIEEEA